MEATELRIGNYLLLLGKIIEVECISNLPLRKDRYWIKPKNMIETKTIHFKPIPLTEQWLLDFGFEKKSWFTKKIVIEWIYYQLDDFIVYLLPDCFEVELITKSGEQFNLFKNWDHVHQLQNVYFALNNNELIRKL